MKEKIWLWDRNLKRGLAIQRQKDLLALLGEMFELGEMDEDQYATIVVVLLGNKRPLRKRS